MKVHEEGVAAPAETVLNERVGEFCAMEEICSRYADGMGGPCHDIGMRGRQVVGIAGC